MGPVLLLSCALLAAAPAAPAPLPSVAIDLAPLDRPTFEALEQAGIYQGLVVRLVTERVALVDPTERADIVLRMERGAPDELVVTARGAGGERSRRVPVRDLGQEAVRLRLVHVGVELVGQVRDLPAPGPAAAAPAAAPPPGRARPGPRLALDGGLLWSAAKAAPMARLAGTVPLGPGELGASAVLHRPSPGGGLEVTEWGLLAAVGTGERRAGGRARLSAGLDVGVWQHRWRYSGVGDGGSGARLGPAALVHAEAAYRPAPAWRVGLSAGLLWTSAEREHRTATRTLWRAPALRPFLALEVGAAREAGN